MFKGFSRTPWFWIAFVAISLTGVGTTIKYFKSVFPIANVDFQVDRSEILSKAKALADKHNLGLKNYSSAASFKTDENVKTYVELEAGGTPAFNDMIRGSLYSPYFWHVRHFQEGETKEVSLYFKPDGTPYGFLEKIPENEDRPALSQSDARRIAEENARDWGINLDEYTLVEPSKDVKPNGRADYSFVYERPDTKIGEAHYRLGLHMNGNKFTGFNHFIKIPETFFLKYQEIRSANNTIALIASLAMALLYLIFGCIVGLFLLRRRRWVIWKQALIWAGIFSLFHVIEAINTLPLQWMAYDTALSKVSFLTQFFIQLLMIPLSKGAMLFLSFAAAESLTRKAFGQHLQLWNIWSSRVASSIPVLGRTLGGYLIVGFDLVFIIGIYFITQTYFGWWVPSDTMIDPDILATYMPWFSPVANALHAGFWEECLFRAVPLAGAALIGTYYGRRKLFLSLGFIIQVLIFSAAHANYPSLPAYARLIELIIPSCIFGAIYLMYGLLPSIISHYIYDLVLMAQPLFASQASGSWFDKVMVIICGLMPLIIIGIRRFKEGSWKLHLPAFAYNSSWKPSEIKQVIQHKTTAPTKVIIFTKRIKTYVCSAGIAATILWFIATPFHNSAPPLSIKRSKAIELATTTLHERGVVLDDPWQPLATITGVISVQDRFVWQEKQSEYENLMQKHYLDAPSWSVRFVRFTGTVDERKEEYIVFISDSGAVIRVRHQLPESQKGITFSEQNARKIVMNELETMYEDPLSLNEVSAVPIKLPERTDWIFTLGDKKSFDHQGGEARISLTVSGKEITDTVRFVHVPEQWVRNDRSMHTLFQTFANLCAFLLGILLLLGAFYVLMSGLFSSRSLLIYALCLLGLWLFNLWNAWARTVYFFNTAEPFNNQLVSRLGITSLGFLFLAGYLSLLVSLIKGHRSLKPQKNRLLTSISLGIMLPAIQATIKMISNLEPKWASYSSLATRLPGISTMLSFIAPFIESSIAFVALFILIDHFIKMKSLKTKSVFILWTFIGIISIGAAGITHIPGWIIGGILTGLFMYFAYLYLFRFDPALALFTIATTTILEAITQIALTSTPLQTPILLGSLVGIIGITWLANKGYHYLHSK